MGYPRISIRAWYKHLLITPEDKIKRLVDLYNDGRLPPNLRAALEIVDGLPIED